MDIKAALNKIASRQDLTGEEMRSVMTQIMEGNATPSQIGAFLMGMRVKGETVGEIAAAVSILRDKMVPVPVPEPENTIDIVGTGGDGAETLNISTASAFVTATVGVPVAKHGNRAFSSKSGAADVLSALGVNLDCDFRLIERAIAEANVGFMMAPRHHSATRHVAGTRVELGTRTIFNLLGPLSNPAGVKRQLVGVFDRKWLEPMARTFGNLGSIHTWVVHGSDGLDEITTTGPTHVCEFKGGQVRSFEVTPEDAGLRRAKIDELRGGTPQENAAALRAVLAGAPGPYRDIVRMNAGAALIVAGRAPSLRAGADIAAEALDSGRAKAVLDKLVAITNAPPPPPPKAEAA